MALKGWKWNLAEEHSEPGELGTQVSPCEYRFEDIDILVFLKSSQLSHASGMCCRGLLTFPNSSISNDSPNMSCPATSVA